MVAPDRGELSSLRAKLAYGFGSIAYGVKDFGFGALLLLYYNQVVGLPAAEVSTAILIVLCIDAFVDPMVGQISDNLRTRLGRRHPFMYASAIPVAVSFYFLWVPPLDWSQGALFWYLVGVATLVRIFISFYEIPSSALIPEMSENYDQRTRFVAWRYFFMVGAGVVMGFTTYRMLFFADASHPVAQLNPASYPRFAIVAGVVMLTSILVSATATVRYVPLFRQPVERRVTLGMVLREVVASVTHPQFLILVLAAVFGSISTSLGATLLLYFNTYFWKLTAGQIGLFALTGVGAAIFGPLLAGLLSRRLGKKNAALVFYFTCVSVMIMPISLRLLGMFPANGTTLLFVLLFLERSTTVILGVGCLILFSSMMADVVDDNTLKTGRRSEGLFFASMSFIAKVLSGAGAFIAGILLQVAHFPAKANPATLDPAVPVHLAELYLPVLIFCYAIGITALSRYRITKAQHEDNVRRLNEGVDLDTLTPAVPRPAE